MRLVDGEQAISAVCRKPARAAAPTARGEIASDLAALDPLGNFTLSSLPGRICAAAATPSLPWVATRSSISAINGDTTTAKSSRSSAGTQHSDFGRPVGISTSIVATGHASMHPGGAVVAKYVFEEVKCSSMKGLRKQSGHYTQVLIVTRTPV
jgi:hypothetical protein